MSDSGGLDPCPGPDDDPYGTMEGLSGSLKDYMTTSGWSTGVDLSMPATGAGSMSSVSAIDNSYAQSFLALDEEDRDALMDMLDIFKQVTSKKGKIAMMREMIWDKEDKEETK
jgi:hypothetical protein